jgi:hypothetical protein
MDSFTADNAGVIDRSRDVHHRDAHRRTVHHIQVVYNKQRAKTEISAPIERAVAFYIATAQPHGGVGGIQQVNRIGPLNQQLVDTPINQNTCIVN